MHKNLFPGAHNRHISKTLSSYNQHAFGWQCMQHTQGSRYVIQLGVDTIHFTLGKDFEHMCNSRQDKKDLAVSLIKQQFLPTILVKTNANSNWTILSWMPKCISANVQCKCHITIARIIPAFLGHATQSVLFPTKDIYFIFYFFGSNNSHYFFNKESVKNLNIHTNLPSNTTYSELLTKWTT